MTVRGVGKANNHFNPVIKGPENRVSSEMRLGQDKANGSETGKHTRANEGSKNKESKEAAARGIYDPPTVRLIPRVSRKFDVQPVALQSC